MVLRKPAPTAADFHFPSPGTGLREAAEAAERAEQIVRDLSEKIAGMLAALPPDWSYDIQEAALTMDDKGRHMIAFPVDAYPPLVEDVIRPGEPGGHWDPPRVIERMATWFKVARPGSRYRTVTIAEHHVRKAADCCRVLYGFEPKFSIRRDTEGGMTTTKD
jgi:hypothetical protein